MLLQTTQPLEAQVALCQFILLLKRCIDAAAVTVVAATVVIAVAVTIVIAVAVAIGADGWCC